MQAIARRNGKKSSCQTYGVNLDNADQELRSLMMQSLIFLGHKEPLTASQLLSNNLYVNFEEAYTCNFLVFKIAANMGQRE